MANIIPMVSSTPPPMDEAPSFDEWEEESRDSDASPGDSPSTDGRISYVPQAEVSAQKKIDVCNTVPVGQQSDHDAMERNQAPDAEEDDEFSDFSQFEGVNGTCAESSSNFSNFVESPPVTHLPLTNKLQGNGKAADDNEDGFISAHICDNRTSINNNFLSSQHKDNSLQESLTDSGLYSNDVSPKSDIPKSDGPIKYGSDNTNSNSNSDIEDNFGDFQDSSDINAAVTEQIQYISNDAILEEDNTLSKEAISSNIISESHNVGTENVQSSVIVDSHADVENIKCITVSDLPTETDPAGNVKDDIGSSGQESSASDPPDNVEDDRSASCDPTGNEEDDGPASCDLSGNEEDDRPASCDLSGNVEDGRPASCDLPGNEKDDRPESCDLSGNVEDGRPASCDLPGNEEDDIGSRGLDRPASGGTTENDSSQQNSMATDCNHKNQISVDSDKNNLRTDITGNILVNDAVALDEPVESICNKGTEEDEFKYTDCAEFSSRVSPEDVADSNNDSELVLNCPEEDNCNDLESGQDIPGLEDDLVFRSPVKMDSQESDGDDASKFANFEFETSTDGANWAAFDTNSTNVDVAQDEDFGEFDSHQNLVDDNDDDFGDFGAFEESGSMKPSSGDDGWANFETSSQMSSDNNATQVEDVTTSSTSAQVETEKFIPFSNPDILMMLSGCFADNTGYSQLTPYLLDKAILEDIHNKTQPSRYKVRQKNGKSSSPATFWTSIQNMEETEAVSFQWGDCCLNKKLFQTLRIDPRNILKNRRKTNVPIFAADLGLLQPSMAPTRARSCSETENALVDTSKAEALPPSGQDLPPVQFDWSTSGLTNPLESSAKSLDLDFLTVQEQENTNNKTAFKQDHSSTPRPMQPLEDILASMKFNSTIRAPTKVDDAAAHSPEVSAIVKSLPDLSFMKAKVLMFPIRQMDM